MRYPLVDGHGNFGSVDGDCAAAMRYTEARLATVAMELLRDLDKETVDFGPQLRRVDAGAPRAAGRFPNLLVNGSAGIAVGMATNIPPHNLGEVIDATMRCIDNPEIDRRGAHGRHPGPGLPDRRRDHGPRRHPQGLQTGRGSSRSGRKAHIEQIDRPAADHHHRDPLPGEQVQARREDRRAGREKKLTEISDLRDESDRKGMRVVIELKTRRIPQVVLNKLFKHTQLQNGFGVIMLALVDGVPRTLTLKEMLNYYSSTRRTSSSGAPVRAAQGRGARPHPRGLLIALDNIDEVIKIIRGVQDDDEAKARLMERFELSEIQTDAILEMRLRRLTGLERHKIEDELAELRRRSRAARVLADVDLVLQIIKDELPEMRASSPTSAAPRSSAPAEDLDVEDLIAEEDMVVTITKAGYVKRLPVATYRQQKRGGKGLPGVNLKENDFVEHLFIARPTTTCSSSRPRARSTA